MVLWGTNQYTTDSMFSQCINSTVFNLMADAHIRHVLVWQWYLTDAHIQSIANLCASTDPPLELWVDLDYDVEDAVDLVTKLGNKCSHYEVCKEPHVEGHCRAAPTVYADRWRDVVTACREVNPDAWYGGPVSGRPGLRADWYTEWLDMNSDIIDSSNTFISYHWYPHYSGGLPSKATLISRATSQIATDAGLLRDYCNDIIGEELNIALTEFNWTADPSASPDYSTTDEAFMDDWTAAAMNACINNDLWAAHFWNWGGYIENTMAIIRNQSHSYTPKYQYYSIQDFLEGSDEKPFSAGGTLKVLDYGTKTFASGGHLLAQAIKAFTSGGYLEEEEVGPGTILFSQGGHLQGLGTIPFVSGGHLIAAVPENTVPFTSGGWLINEGPAEAASHTKFAEALSALENHQVSEHMWIKGMWKPGMWEQNNLARKAISELEKHES